ncbi:MAG TPA: TetR/AcrR family transcriptional regulator [Candidatus Anaerotruncus excrementipullorum]|uniref:TetR/AcrR family transcriptional regulator n=1 Tax=Candidatus Anaerotruncus excrementipullorum TaxID=2838465 RepID=A0A9D1WQE8_9FIRM|nr:TetR/AcrR family transcriptional regulator [Candidatus Anaerotruncus excrementipullorum]
MARKSYSEQEREQVREQLLQETTRCIVERGLIHSSVDLLCKRVGISKTFFYSLYPSKEELVLQTLRHQQPRLLRRAQALMDDPTLTWRQGAEQFLRDCCYGTKSSIAVLSIEEEQEAYRCLAPENFQVFRRDQLVFFGQVLAIFGIPAGTVDPRLFGNLALSMMMVYKAIPDTMPFLFPEVAEDMVEFQIRALVDEMEQARERAEITP